MEPKFWLNVIFVVIGGELIVEGLKFLFSGKVAFLSQGKPQIRGFIVALVCLVLIGIGGWVFWLGLEPLLKQFL